MVYRQHHHLLFGIVSSVARSEVEQFVIVCFVFCALRKSILLTPCCIIEIASLRFITLDPPALYCPFIYLRHITLVSGIPVVYGISSFIEMTTKYH